MTADDAPWLIVGLGNPGPAYEATRHNIGFLVADEITSRMGSRMAMHKKARAQVAEGRLQHHRVIVAKPMQYMNESGGPTKALMSFYKVPAEHVVVIHDELDLNFAQLRLKRGGGDNGHNGLKSIRSATDTGDWYRVRVGIGRPPGRQDPADFVLKPWSGAERRELGVLVGDSADAVEMLLHEGLELAQNRYNS